jgi:hypothetical protein
VYQGAGRNVGSTIGATPKVTDTIANPAKMIDAHAPSVISDETNRSCVAMREYKAVDENRAMSISKIECLNNEFVAGQGFKVRMKATISSDHL